VAAIRLATGVQPNEAMGRRRSSSASAAYFILRPVRDAMSSDFPTSSPARLTALFCSACRLSRSRRIIPHVRFDRSCRAYAFFAATFLASFRRLRQCRMHWLDKLFYV
jgi:hypothetical protein